MIKYSIAWWNVENLFDVFNAPLRPERLKKTLKSELKGWTQSVLNKKINQLASIIKQINNSKGPDILGVCEIENEEVVKLLSDKMEELTGRKYKVAHHNTKDARGIDVAVIYDKTKFKELDTFAQVLYKRNATRDIFQVNFRTKSPDDDEKGNEFVVVGNHWPARMGGELDSAPYRMMAGETLAYWHSRILEEHGKECPIIAMGDFNDEPFNRSVTGYALSTRNKTKVMKARSPRFYNLMWAEMGKGNNSYYYNGWPNMLDQFLVSKGLLKNDSSIKVDIKTVKVEIFPEMTFGTYKAPKRFGRPSKKSTYNPEGYSDHFPISVILEEDESSL
ncbi:MAG: endonuclease/exonuclease/phosphatase [candidate division Zixibacteria bacterium]|nr:endonuclease/exonuclease/phosphatase [candidate division Zixibacteria bacterium]